VNEMDPLGSYFWPPEQDQNAQLLAWFYLEHIRVLRGSIASVADSLRMSSAAMADPKRMLAIADALDGMVTNSILSLRGYE